VFQNWNPDVPECAIDIVADLPGSAIANDEGPRECASNCQKGPECALSGAQNAGGERSQFGMTTYNGEQVPTGL
jgi:hypothetical protein